MNAESCMGTTETKIAPLIGSNAWLDEILGRVWCRDMSGDEAAVELSWLTDRIEELESDAMRMALRLLGEDENSMSPECRLVMRKWRPKCELLLSTNAPDQRPSTETK